MNKISEWKIKEAQQEMGKYFDDVKSVEKESENKQMSENLIKATISHFFLFFIARQVRIRRLLFIAKYKSCLVQHISHTNCISFQMCLRLMHIKIINIL